MKKLIERIRHSDLWQNFIIGVLATAVGVGLSFEVDHLVEQHKQQQIKRQTAMMAIYDIDDIIHNFIRYKERDDAFYKITMYLFTHQDELESVRMDSLWMAGEYLFYYNDADELDWADNGDGLYRQHGRYAEPRRHHFLRQCAEVLPAAPRNLTELGKQVIEQETAT